MKPEGPREDLAPRPRAVITLSVTIAVIALLALSGLAACTRKDARPAPGAVSVPSPPPPLGPRAPADVATAPADAERSASGLAWKVIRAGSGVAHPAASDTVRVDYAGWTPDGKLVDSTAVRGGPVPLALASAGKGLAEGIPLMVVGEKRRFWIPPELAYNPRPGKTPTPLVFDVELRDILAPAAGH